MRILLVVCLLATVLPSRAEYRVALVIGEEASRASATRSLEHFGFRCEGSPNLTEKDLKRKIEGFAGRTPTLGTAVVHFSGSVSKDSLVSSNKRLVSVGVVFDLLSERGGSAKNLLIVASEETPQVKGKWPEDCIFSSKNIAVCLAENGVRGTGSKAIAPPSQFVLGKKAGDEWVNERGMIFCWCPPGTFTAGSPEGTPGRYANEVQSKVAIKEGFWIGKYEHTQGQKLRNLSRGMIGSHKNHPINKLHWDDGSRMLTRTLSEEQRKAGLLPADWQYSLPTEDQWEYAARAGSTTRYYFGDDMTKLPQHGNFADKTFYDSGDIYAIAAHRTLEDGFARLAPVGSFRANPWGLHDVYGNVTEWCIDRGARGGSWVSVPENCRSAYRDSYSSRNEQIYLGYRIIIQRTPPQKVGKKK